MGEVLVTLLFIGFFAMFGLREMQSRSEYGLVLGTISVALAIYFILNGIARF